jgi:photosystem II stability/assembly factor-like uncharacterized protein
MKRILLINLLLFSAILFPQTGWFWQNPKPAGLDLYDVESLSPLVFIAAGKAGSIIKSTNSGRDWTQIYLAIDINIHAFSFINENTGFALGTRAQDGTAGDTGNLVFMKSTDSGDNWSEKDMPQNANLNSGQYDIEFADDVHGVIIWTNSNYNCEILATSDGGINWSLVHQNDNYGSVELRHNGSGLIVGQQGKILRTVNYGFTWTEIIIDVPEPLLNVKLVNDYLGFAVGSLGTIVKTTDGGLTWVLQNSGEDSLLLTAVDFIDEYNGIITGENGIILRTTNGGTTWVRQVSPISIFLYSIAYSNSNNIIAVGESGTIIISANSGNNWVLISKDAAPGAELSSVHFTNSDVGTAVGYPGVILRTSNAGVDWIQQYSGVEEQLLSAFFINEFLGFTCGSNGVILKTTDGGENWISLPTGTTQTLRGMQFISSSSGHVVGDSGIILSTNDGGSNWHSSNVLQGISLHGVFFLNELHGWVSGGYNGSVWKTTDGGITWDLIFWGSMIYKIYFSDINTGIITGDKGDGTRLVRRTTNGGQTWYAPYFDSNFTLSEWRICLSQMKKTALS